MILYSSVITSRLEYIADLVGELIDGRKITLTNSRTQFLAYDGPAINYSLKKIRDTELHVVPHGLLEETGIHSQDVHCLKVDGQVSFFKTTGDTGFDIFAASFYLLARYEEYLPHGKDVYGRYAHENSIAFREGFLDRPIINEWLIQFSTMLNEKFPMWTPFQRSFSLIPTYDIDEAYAHKHKNRWRTIGGLLKALVHGNWSAFMERINVLKGKMPDPYDAFEWMHQLNADCGLKPKYFFLVPEQHSRYDRNILPAVPAMKSLITDHASRYTIGIHPSWQSGDDETLLTKEISTLEQIAGKTVQISRQHYIRLTLPHTYRELEKNGIKEDYSMGYGSINGFRASIAVPFFWYDLESEKRTGLQIFPFCFMEANSFFEQEHSPDQAAAEMEKYYETIRKIDGSMIMIWHNTFLGTAEAYKGWREVYSNFMRRISMEK